MAKKNLTEGPVWRALAQMSAPMSLGILAVLSVGIADAYFLGKLGEAPLAAVGFVYPVTTALSSLAIGLSAGANAAISQALWREDEARDIYRMGFHALGMGLTLSAVIALVIWLLHPPIFGAMGAGDGVMAEISAYIPLWAASFPFLVLLMITNAIFRANGDAAYASVFMILAALVNIGLNPLLIFGALGIEGIRRATRRIMAFTPQISSAATARTTIANPNRGRAASAASPQVKTTSCQILVAAFIRSAFSSIRCQRTEGTLVPGRKSNVGTSAAARRFPIEA